VETGTQAVYCLQERRPARARETGENMLRKVTTTQFGTVLGHCECGEIIPLSDAESPCECGIVYDKFGEFLRTTATWRANWEDNTPDIASLKFREWE
jgi:hypothetical protein